MGEKVEKLMDRIRKPEQLKYPLDIVLFDANSYFASCHQAVDNNLRDKPLLVAGDPKNRTGIILTSSFEARLYGVKTAMPLNQALRLCPEAIVVSPDFSLYLELSEKMWQIVERYTDHEHIEVVSIDECFADFTGSHLLFGSTVDIAKRVQREIYQELHLGVSVGISFCKIFAKLASDYDRDPKTRIKRPRSFTVFEPDNLKTKIWPLQVDEISGIGSQLKKNLNSLGIRTIGDLALSDPQVLKKHFGIYGLRIYEWANGRDHRPVNSGEKNIQNHSIGRSITLPKDLTDQEEIAQVLLSLSDSVGRKMRREKAKTRTITLTVKTTKFKTRTFSTTLHEPTDLTDMIYRESLKLYKEKWLGHEAIRLLGVTAGRLQTGMEQLSLFQEEIEEQTELSKTMDRIRDKYGSEILVRGTQLLSLSKDISNRNKKDD